MPYTLYLLRHAEAVAKEAQQDDKARPLSQTGIRDALHLGAWFLARNIGFDMLVASSAERTEQTAELVAESMKRDNPRIVSEDVLYEASARQLLDYVNNLEDTCHEVLLTGHNPGISYLAEYLTKADIGEMAPGSVAIIRFELSSWKAISENTGVLQEYVTPEDLKTS